MQEVAEPGLFGLFLQMFPSFFLFVCFLVLKLFWDTFNHQNCHILDYPESDFKIA